MALATILKYMSILIMLIATLIGNYAFGIMGMVMLIFSLDKNTPL